MYSEEYDDEELEKQNNNNFFINFYYNNKILIWIFIGIIGFIILMSLLTGGGGTSGGGDDKNYVVTVEPSEVIVSIGKSYNLNAKVEGDANAKIEWSVKDETIATIDNRNVTGVNYGTTTVYATYIHDEEKYTGECTVTVANGNPNVSLTSVEFKEGDLLMPLNSTYDIALALSPPQGYVEKEVFTSSNPSVATVDNNGTVKAVGVGEATIAYDVNNGRFKGDLQVYVDTSYSIAEIIVTPNDLRFDGELRKIKVGENDELTYSFYPSNTDTTRFTWKSSDESVVTVDNNGYIRGIKQGTASVTVTALNGRSDRIDIEVENDIVPVSDIYVGVNEISLTVGGQSQVITPSVSPDNASNKALNYSIADSTIATVSSNNTGTQATITAVSVGSTKLIIRSVDGVEKSVNITVTGSNGGGNNNNNNNGGGNSDNQTIVVRSSAGNLANNLNDVLDKYAPGPTQITITLHSGVSKIRYCYTKNYNVDCVPNTDMNGTGTLTIPNGEIYLLCVKKYDRNGNEIGSSSANFSNGVLHYYINTAGKGGKKTELLDYTISGDNVYDTIQRAQMNGYGKSVTVIFSTKATNGIKVCYRKPNDTTQRCFKVEKNQSIPKTFSENGDWEIRIYNPDTNKLVAAKYINIYIKQTPTPSIKPTTAPTAKPATTPVTCNSPKKINVYTSGLVEWDDVSDASFYQYRVGSNGVYNVWQPALKNKIDNLKPEIISQVGRREIQVRAVCGTIYSNPRGAYVTVYSLSIEKGDGISSVSGGGKYIDKSQVTVSATPSSNYEFLNWTGNGNIYSIKNSFTFTITGNMTIKANAKQTSTTTSNTPPTFSKSFAFNSYVDLGKDNPTSTQQAIAWRPLWGYYLGIRFVYSNNTTEIAFAGSTNLNDINKLSYSNYKTDCSIGKDAGLYKVAKIEEDSATPYNKCVKSLEDLTMSITGPNAKKASNATYNFAFDLDQLDYYGANKVKANYYVSIRAVNSNHQMSAPVIFKIVTDGTSEQANWRVTKCANNTSCN